MAEIRRGRRVGNSTRLSEHTRITQIEGFLREYQNWANVIFDQTAGVSEGPLNHLYEEIEEIKEAIINGVPEKILEEHADGMFLLMNSLMLNGFSFVELVNYMMEKFHEDLVHRKWYEKNEFGYYKHIKDETNDKMVGESSI